MLKRLKLATFIIILGLIAGCAGFYHPTKPARIVCEGARCDRLWQRAQTWLATNSRYRIQIANDSIIQTYGPHENVSGAVAYTITKNQLPDGKTMIEIHGACHATIYGCVFDPAPPTNLLYRELESIQ